MIRSPHTIHFTFSKLQSAALEPESKGDGLRGGGRGQVNIYVHVGWGKGGGGHG
jgi:hypothetical protein